MEYKIVEAWGALRYYFPDSDELLYEESDYMRQCYWIVKFNPDEHEIISWEEMYPSYESAERALKEIKGE